MKIINLIKQLDNDEITLVAGANKNGCDCKCADLDGHSFRVDCVPHIDYCEYVCKVILFEAVKVKACEQTCDASSFHGRYPDALVWMQNKQAKEPIDEEL